jgi:hypothetical protein
MEDKILEDAFTRVKSEVGHLRIIGCLVSIHVPKEKRTNIEPSRKKGTFVCYSETSKAYCIYFLGQRQIEVSRDLTFGVELVFRISRESYIDIDMDHEDPRVTKIPSPTSDL